MKRILSLMAAAGRLTDPVGGGAPAGGWMLGRLAFLIAFVGFKVVALFGMLWLARVASPDVFGGIELALSVGLIVVGVGLLGVPGGVTRMALALDEPLIGDHLSFAALCIAGPATAAAILGLIIGAPPIAVLIPAVCAVTSFQSSGTTFARIRARPMLNSFIDPLPVLSILAIAGGLWAAGRLTLPSLALGVTILASVLSTALLIGFVRNRRPDFFAAYRRALGISLPLLALSGVAMIVGAGLRPLLGVRFSLADLALYSLCFRLCAPSMLMHQILGTAFFARIYKATDRNFDRIAAGLMAACVVTVVAVWLALPLLVELVFPTYVPALAGLTVLFPMVGLQVVYWILIAFLEMKVGRHAVATGASVVGYVIFGAFAVAFSALPVDTLLRATLLFDIALAAFAISQLVLLHRRAVKLPLIWGAVPFVGLTCGLLVTLAR